MKYRDVVIFSGQHFKVPQGLQRIDSGSTHGWQLRYGGTQLFSDFSQDGSGAQAAFAAATKELARRIAKLPVPSALQSRPNANKTSDLPVGISGPVIRQRPGSSVREAALAVLVPRYGQVPQRRSVYIGNENTYTPERYLAALERAKKIRQAAVDDYEAEATRAKRKDGRALKSQTQGA